MRNLIFSILGSLGLALLGLPALMPTVTDAGGTPDHHANLHSFQAVTGQAAIRAVADEEQNDGVAAEDAASNGAAGNDEAYSDNSGANDEKAKAKTPSQKSTAKGAKKRLQVDLSDLVIRPV